MVPTSIAEEEKCKMATTASSKQPREANGSVKSTDNAKNPNSKWYVHDLLADRSDEENDDKIEHEQEEVEEEKPLQTKTSNIDEQSQNTKIGGVSPPKDTETKWGLVDGNGQTNGSGNHCSMADDSKTLEQQKQSPTTEDIKARGPGPIPDKWTQFIRGIHQPMRGTRFFPFKTPLRPEFFDLEEYDGGEEGRFEVNNVIEHLAQLKLTLGLVIDLTNTNRYYNAYLWKNHRIRYKKIRCPFHEVNSDENLYAMFLETVNKFLEENSYNNKLIGVHCTHGLNRTGYLICRYMIEQHNWKSQDAIDAFNTARGYPMERQAYIDSLHQLECRIRGLSLDEPRRDEEAREKE